MWGTSQEQRILIWDSYRCHTTDPVLKMLSWSVGLVSYPDPDSLRIHYRIIMYNVIVPVMSQGLGTKLLLKYSWYNGLQHLGRASQQK